MRDRANGKAATCCAIYTRESSEEGLEQDFNSLDAQRESSDRRQGDRAVLRRLRDHVPKSQERVEESF